MGLEEFNAIHFNALKKGRPGAPVGKPQALEKQAEGTVIEVTIIYNFLKFQAFLPSLMTK